MRNNLATVFLVLSLAPASACPLELAQRYLGDYVIKFNGEQASKTIPYYEATSALTNKAKVPNLPMRDQLTMAEQTYFQFLREKTLQANGRELALSNYQRDVTAIGDMVKVADALRMGSEFEEKDPRRFYSNILEFLRLMTSDDKPELIEYDEKNKCFIEAGIRHSGWMVAKIMVPTMSKETPSAMAVLEEISEKYRIDFKVDGAEKKIQNNADRQRAILALATMRNAYKFWDYMRDIRNLIKIHQASFDLYTELDAKLENMKDEADYDKIVNWIGVRGAQLSQKDKFFGLALSQISQRMPSDKAVRDKGTANQIAPIIGNQR